MRSILEIKNRKADIASFFYVVVFLFVIAFGFLIFAKIANEAMPEIANVIGESQPKAANVTLNVKNTIVNLLDAIFLIILIGSLIALAILSFYLDVPPAFAFLFLIFVGLAIVLAVIFSNSYGEASLVSTLNSTVSSSQFTIQRWVMGNMPFVIALFGTVIVIIIYSKARFQPAGY